MNCGGKIWNEVRTNEFFTDNSYFSCRDIPSVSLTNNCCKLQQENEGGKEEFMNLFPNGLTILLMSTDETIDFTDLSLCVGTKRTVKSVC